MNNITASLSTAKRLRDAGWDKETEFVYDPKMGVRWIGEEYSDCLDIGFGVPTAEEILRELPWEYDDEEYEYEDGYDRCLPPNAYISHTLYLEVGRNSEDEWRVSYNCPAGGYNKFGGTLANAAAEMWIYLKENNLLPQ